ncbi:hypothetical protein OW521_13310 [Arthrobacter sp. MMS18-M83]|nr:hypothetical protein [Arthrobacter sp. MMS18-M83]WAH95433.1 hypothetical protein OW521_13310 [Arthrobacter sp. MMS18-M83]
MALWHYDHRADWTSRPQWCRKIDSSRLIAGKLTPTLGRVDTVGDVGYLPQTLTLGQHTTVAALLRIDGILTALHAVEGGDVDERNFDTVGDDSDIESRADEALHEIAFSASDLWTNSPSNTPPDTGTSLAAEARQRSSTDTRR